MAKASGNTRGGRVASAPAALSPEEVDKALRSVLDWNERSDIQSREHKANAVLEANRALADYYGNDDISVGSIRSDERGTFATIAQVRSKYGVLHTIKENFRHYFEVALKNGGRMEVRTLQGIKEYLDFLDAPGRKSTQKAQEFAERFDRPADYYVIPQEINDIMSILNKYR